MPEPLEAVLAEFLVELDPPETPEQAEATLALDAELAVDAVRILAGAIGAVQRQGLAPGLALFEAERQLARRRRWGGVSDG